jgi:hypothetical protein
MDNTIISQYGPIMIVKMENGIHVFWQHPIQQLNIDVIIYLQRMKLSSLFFHKRMI